MAIQGLPLLFFCLCSFFFFCFLLFLNFQHAEDQLEKEKTRNVVVAKKIVKILNVSGLVI